MYAGLVFVGFSSSWARCLIFWCWSRGSVTCTDFHSCGKTAGANSPDSFLFPLISLHTSRVACFLKTSFCVDVGWFIRHLSKAFFFNYCQCLLCVFSGGPLDWLDYKDLWRCWVVKKINYVEFSQLWRLCPSYALHKGKKTSHGNELIKKKLFIYLFITTCHTSRCDYRSINSCDVANRINGVPRPTYWGYCCRYELYGDADAVVCAGVKSCAGTESSPIVKCNLAQMWKQGSSLHMCAYAYLKWQLSVSHGGSMIESISRWSIDHATACSQNAHYSARRITYFTSNIEIGGWRSRAGSPGQN